MTRGSAVTLDYAIKCDIAPPDGREAAYKFAEFSPSDHVRNDGSISPLWEASNIVRVKLPQPLAYLDGRQVTAIAVHRKVERYIKAALIEVCQAGLWTMLEPYGGGFNVRPSKSGGGLSMHSLGMALDFDPARNAYHAIPSSTRFGGTEDGRTVVRIMETNGWFWGGRFRANQDAQHFQIVTGC